MRKRTRASHLHRCAGEKVNTWQSYLTWLPIAVVLEFIAIGSSANPPLTDGALLIPHCMFCLVVLLGPLTLFSHADAMFAELIFWLAMVFAVGAVGILVWNRNRKALLNAVAGLLWCGSGAIGLFILIVFTI